ncbi:hypothetical protein Syun_000485 [Stephania yunnanensis]|uniref:Uncharacterized protein n=1 Tax=Stephania yunnanensis TaxID=152371 RepID=A0AAP0LEW3_9MAGN
MNDSGEETDDMVSSLLKRQLQVISRCFLIGSIAVYKNGLNSVSDPSLISNGSETEIIRSGIYSVSDPSLNQKRNSFSVSDPISDDVFKDGTHSVSVPFLIEIRNGIFANQKRKIPFLICCFFVVFVTVGADQPSSRPGKEKIGDYL